METEEDSEETANDLDAARAALEKAAEGEGDDAERARRALKALDGKDPNEETAESDTDDDDENKKGKGESASAPGTSATVSAPASTAAGELGAIVVQLNNRVQQLEGASEKSLKAALLASRPDLPKTVVQLVASKSYAASKEIIDAIPVPRSTVNSKPAATAVVGGTRGQGQTSSQASVATNLSGNASLLDERMGLTPKTAQVTRTPHSLEFDIGDSNARKPRELAPNAGTVGGKAVSQ